MFTIMKHAFMIITYVLSLLMVSTHAIPIQRLTTRDVVSPPILTPTKGATWHVGQTATVTWYAIPIYVRYTGVTDWI